MRPSAKLFAAAACVALLAVVVFRMLHHERAAAPPSTTSTVRPEHWAGASREPVASRRGDEPASDRAGARPDRVHLGLQWLCDRQGSDGGWGDPATTGRVVLALSGAGETPQSGTFREALAKALSALRHGQDADGCLVPRTSARLLRDHAIAGVALVECYGVTQSPSLKQPAQDAVAFALRARAPRGAWNFAPPDDAEIDIEATAWMTLLLNGAAMCELDVDEAAPNEIATALDGITDRATGRIRVPERTPAPLSDDAATAIGLLVRIQAGRRPDSDALTGKAAAAMLSTLPAADTTDVPYVYFGSLAMLRLGGDPFRAWYPALHAIAWKDGRAEGPDKGSWDPPGGGTADARILSTVQHLLLCEFWYGPVGHASMRR